METTTARYAGILFHPTSIKTKYGIGDLGQKAYQFVDKLHSTGATLWQILPLGPTGYGNSPYASRSTFAGNELLIDLETLVREGYLNRNDIAFPPEYTTGRVEFDRVREYKLPLLKQAARAFLLSRKERKAFADFKKQNESWLDGYAVFMTLYDEKYHDARWMLWDEKYSQQTLKKYSVLGISETYVFEFHRAVAVGDLWEERIVGLRRFVKYCKHAARACHCGLKFGNNARDLVERFRVLVRVHQEGREKSRRYLCDRKSAARYREKRSRNAYRRVYESVYETGAGVAHRAVKLRLVAVAVKFLIDFCVIFLGIVAV